MSKARDRAYERRRYEEWQKSLATKKQKRRQTQQIVAAVVSSVAALAVIIGVTVLVTRGGKDDADTTAASTPTASASASAAPSASASAAAPVKGGCTPSTLAPIASPKQTSKVPAKSIAAGKTFTLVLKTTCGSITIALDGKKAPQAVASTVALSRSGFYDKTPCGRISTEGLFVLQCGDPTGTNSGGPGYNYGPIENAPKDGVYKAGVVAMARSNTPDSQGSQFFLVFEDSDLGKPTAQDKYAGQYTVIGKITKGLDVVKKVAKSGSDNSNPAGGGVPVTPISIETAKVTGG